MLKREQNYKGRTDEYFGDMFAFSIIFNNSEGIGSSDPSSGKTRDKCSVCRRSSVVKIWVISNLGMMIKLQPMVGIQSTMFWILILDQRTTKFDVLEMNYDHYSVLVNTHLKKFP